MKKLMRYKVRVQNIKSGTDCPVQILSPPFLSSDLGAVTFFMIQVLYPYQENGMVLTLTAQRGFVSIKVVVIG